MIIGEGGGRGARADRPARRARRACVIAGRCEDQSALTVAVVHRSCGARGTAGGILTTH
jgi:hypothetical protein